MRITESRLRQVVREVLNEMSDAEPGRDAYFQKLFADAMNKNPSGADDFRAKVRDLHFQRGEPYRMTDYDDANDYFEKKERESKQGASDDEFRAMMGDEGDELDERFEKLELKVRNLENRVNNLSAQMIER